MRIAIGRKLVLTLALTIAAATAAASAADSVLLPEQQRAFIEDGPGLLLDSAERSRWHDGSAETRDALMAQVEADETLRLAIEARRGDVSEEWLSWLDDRARLLFLHGRPAHRLEVECGQTFVPMEIWSYTGAAGMTELALYEPAPDQPYRLWRPRESKRVLYNREMEYWLEQWEEFGRRIGRRFDVQTCPRARLLDRVTGVQALTDYRPGRPTDADIEAWLAPPADRRAWASAALAEPRPASPPALAVGELEVHFPERRRQRMVARAQIVVPAGVELGVDGEAETPGMTLAVDGRLESAGGIFERFAVRFQIPVADPRPPLALVLDRAVRPGGDFLLHLRVRDEIGGGVAHVRQAFRVPEEPTVGDGPGVPRGALLAVAEEVARRAFAGVDDLLLVPPDRDVILGLWRAEALVMGERIEKVTFSLDGKPQVTRRERPYSAELRLAPFPVEQVVLAEGLDADGAVVAADEVIVNQPRGALRVRIIEPRRGGPVGGRVRVEADVIVPHERRIEAVEILVNDEVVTTLSAPPWVTHVETPGGDGTSYVTVVAELDDGTRAEDVRFLSASEFQERLDVNLVELYTTVTDRGGRPVRDLVRDDFEVLEDGRRREITRFELVENRPLSLGLVLDISGSMAGALPEARRAAVGFLRGMMTSRDSVFAMSFADEPGLLVPPTDDVALVELVLGGLRSYGNTALHDAVVTGLYHFRGVTGRRAMILLSDGDDTASAMPFADAVEYARRSGVAIYPIGLDIGALDLGVRRKLAQLAEETGGRSFIIGRAEELEGVYELIEAELRSQYLLAYDAPGGSGEGEFRTVEVSAPRGMRARTIGGYYP